MTDGTPPPLQGPTSKERKYDRQLRLWAANGQAALEEANLLLLNSGSGVVGVETLKNLVLPGTGRFTILDPAIVSEADLGVNFFLQEEDLGAFRAECSCRLLQELNPDVMGNAITEPLETFITKPNALQPYTLILVIFPVSPEILDIISDHSQATGVPIFYIHCLGFYSQFSIQLPAVFPVVDTHPDPTTTTDLRLLRPWPELLALVHEKTQNLDQLDDEDHGHVSYVLLLLHYLQEWEASHGTVPQNYKEKTEFRELVHKGARTKNADGGEENFNEAVSAVLKSLNKSEPSGAVKEVFAAEECVHLTRDSANFWIIAHAIHDFYRKHLCLPLSGTLPDMKSKSGDYIQLQNIYKMKARKDAYEILRKVRFLDERLERVSPVEWKEVEAFCKSAGYVTLVRGRPPHISRPNALIEWKDRAKFAANALTDPSSLVLLHIAFLALDSYNTSHSIAGVAGTVGTHREGPPTAEGRAAETAKLTGIAHRLINSLISEAGISVENPGYDEAKETVGKIIMEMVRAGGGELHNIAAATGGMVAQEVIKVITKQYVPVDNTCLFDGIESKTSVLRL